MRLLGHTLCFCIKETWSSDKLPYKQDHQPVCPLKHSLTFRHTHLASKIKHFGIYESSKKWLMSEGGNDSMTWGWVRSDWANGSFARGWVWVSDLIPVGPRHDRMGVRSLDRKVFWSKGSISYHMREALSSHFIPQARLSYHKSSPSYHKLVFHTTRARIHTTSARFHTTSSHSFFTSEWVVEYRIFILFSSGRLFSNNSFALEISKALHISLLK